VLFANDEKLDEDRREERPLKDATSVSPEIIP
jgi:hypothetical protein